MTIITHNRLAAGFHALIVLALILGGRTAPAEVIITIAESDGDVVVVSSGSLDLSAAALVGTFNFTGASFANGTFFVSPGLGDFYDILAGPSEIPGDGMTITGGGIAGGDLFGLSWNSEQFPGSYRLYVPAGYTSLSPLSGTFTFLDETIASMGLDPGTVAWTLPSNDSVTMNILAPEPSSVALSSSSLLVVFALFLARRRTA